MIVAIGLAVSKIGRGQSRKVRSQWNRRL